MNTGCFPLLFYGRQPEVNFKTDDSIVPGKILETIVALNKPVDRSHAGTPAGLRALGIALVIEVERFLTVVFHGKDDLAPLLLQVQPEKTILRIFFLRYPDGILQKIRQKESQIFLETGDVIGKTDALGYGDTRIFCFMKIDGQDGIDVGIQAVGMDDRLSRSSS